MIYYIEQQLCIGTEVKKHSVISITANNIGEAFAYLESTGELLNVALPPEKLVITVIKEV